MHENIVKKLRKDNITIITFFLYKKKIGYNDLFLRKKNLTVYRWENNYMRNKIGKHNIKEQLSLT